ncbi:MAG: flagellar basal body L-ring protein FlgH [Bacteroidota bacterium]
MKRTTSNVKSLSFRVPMLFRGTRNLIVIATVLISGAMSAQDLRQNYNRSLFSDQKANQIGDGVTILVVESSSASNDSRTSTSRGSDLSLASSAKNGATSLLDVGASIGTGNSFKGEGATETKGSVRAKISARVDSIYLNGNLWISGSRTITINGEEQVIKISGLVRPSDIQSDNSIYSFNISDAAIVFQGKGLSADNQEPGWLTKFFHWLF